MTTTKCSIFPIVLAMMIVMALAIWMMIVMVLPDLSLPTIQQELDIENMLANVVIDPAYTHALEEHPQDAPIVRECLAQRGAYMQFQIERNKRYLRVCIIDETAGVIGFQIVDIVNRIAKERTAYIKDTICNIKELLDYVGKNGYVRFKGPL